MSASPTRINQTKPNTFCFHVILCISVVRLSQDNMTASCRLEPNFLFLLFFTIAVPNSEQGFHPVDILRGQSSDMHIYAKARVLVAQLGRALGMRGLMALWLLKVPPESAMRRLSTRTPEPESPSVVGADYHGPLRAK